MEEEIKESPLRINIDKANDENIENLLAQKEQLQIEKDMVESDLRNL